MKRNDRTKQVFKLTHKINMHPERFRIRNPKVSLVWNVFWYVAGRGNVHNATIPVAAITLINQGCLKLINCQTQRNLKVYAEGCQTPNTGMQTI